jgi:hypothetical protein
MSGGDCTCGEALATAHPNDRVVHRADGPCYVAAWSDEPAVTLSGDEGVHDHKGYSEERCLRCGWVMGHPALNCNNDDTPHLFRSQLPGQASPLRPPLAYEAREAREEERAVLAVVALQQIADALTRIAALPVGAPSPDGPHSRACGPLPHVHGSACHPNCPTCGGHDLARLYSTSGR